MAHPQPRDLRQRVLTCLAKLSDRDTHALAAADLSSLVASLPPSSVPAFLSYLHSPAAASAAARAHCIRVLSLLSGHHRDALAPFLPNLLAAVIRRLRDPDSAVRSACAHATATMAAHITSPPLSAFIKPLAAALSTEQDLNSQTAAALCLSAAVDAAPDPDPAQLEKLIPKLVKLLKCDSFRAKGALLTLVGSAIGAGGASSCGLLRVLVPCMVEFLSRDDWAARKAAAEAFLKLATVERDMLSEYKASCLKTFENRRYDKVKVVRETMNQMVEAWKKVPDVSDENEISPPPQSQASSKENVSDGHFPPGSRNSCSVDSEAPQMRKKHATASRLPPPDSSFATTARKRTPFKSTINKTNPGMFGKVDSKRPSDWKIEIAVPRAPSLTVVCEDDIKQRNDKVLERGANDKKRFPKPEIKRVLFGKNPDDKMHKVGGFRSGSRVVPCHEESPESTVVVSNTTEDLHRHHRECEDLSLIRKQLVQIENQQSSLLDLLQRFIGSSQNGMRSLETRVHGLELALDEISFDLAASTGRMSNTGSPGATCCMLPGAGFLSSKFRRKTEGRCSTARLSSSGGNSSVAGLRNMATRNGNFDRFQLHGSGGFILNPLAEIHGDLRGVSEVPSSGISKNVHNATSCANGTLPVNDIIRSAA